MTVEFNEFVKDNWSQLLLIIGAIFSFFLGKESRTDKHHYDRSATLNIDIDSLSDSFDLSQRMLVTVREQLDETQKSLDEANRAYAVILIELNKAIDDIKAYKAKTESLGRENKELIKRLHTCEFECPNKKNNENTAR